MAYCALADILDQLEEQKLIQLTDDENLNPATIDSEDPDCADIIARIDKAIADADAIIDSYCEGRYTVPLSPVPNRIRQIDVDVAIYNLYSRRSGGGVPEIRSERYKEVIRFLEKVAEGKITLGASTPAPANTEHPVDIAGNERIFTRDLLDGF
jgi:phage gp36-like protein